MSNQTNPEDKLMLEVSKPNTVAIKSRLPKRVHKLAMRVHINNPRTWNFQETIADLIEAGAKVRLAELSEK